MSLRYSAVKRHQRKFPHSLSQQQLTLGDGLNQDTKVSLLLVEGLGALPQTSSETIVDQSGLDDGLEGVLNRHGAGLVGDLDLLLDLGSGDILNFGSSVRHFG
jgi:hypothetical protein